MLTVGTVKLLQEALFRGYAELITKRYKKTTSINQFTREIAALHANATFDDLEFDFKKDISLASSTILAYINKMGFKLVPKD